MLCFSQGSHQEAYSLVCLITWKVFMNFREIFTKAAPHNKEQSIQIWWWSRSSASFKFKSQHTPQSAAWRRSDLSECFSSFFLLLHEMFVDFLTSCTIVVWWRSREVRNWALAIAKSRATALWNVNGSVNTDFDTKECLFFFFWGFTALVDFFFAQWAHRKGGREGGRDVQQKTTGLFLTRVGHVED